MLVRTISVFCLLSLCACSLFSYPYSPLPKSPSQADVRIVKHTIGETAVPLHPQRIISLDPQSTEVAISLGVKLFGYPQKEIPASWRRSDAVDIGLPPNFEKVLSVKPDLIVSINFGFLESYSLWSHIAPTVVYQITKDVAGWKRSFMQLAQALSQAQKAKRIAALYDARIAQFKASMGEKLKQTQVSVVHIFPGRIVIRTENSFSGSILQELGLDRPLSQKPSAVPNFTKIFGNTSWYFISPELLSLIDADVLFVVTSNFSQPDDAKLAIQQLTAQPLWSKLNVVKQGKVHIVGQYWLIGYYFSANLVLNDLFKYLVENN
ncbi:iron-siderophore ABC transporter substrate-binding protein [uncultured Nostoc sp.]|uniref:iron-siderophore ABC transporter substrate-binding protein n=1 Tax=uncultured Nostoc sp. TaxID=340711 RepID=UPI0035C9A5E0